MDLYNISHFLQIWAFPPGLILLLFLVALLFSIKYRTVGRKLLIFTFVLFWLLSTPIVSQQLINHLQNQYQPFKFSQLGPKQMENSALVVLGSGVENALEYASKHALSDKSLSRLQYAVYAYNESHLPIIVSGGNKDNTATTEADLMRHILASLYNISVKLWENKSRNTKDEAHYIALLAANHHIKTLYLITNAWHMPRSMLAFLHCCNTVGIQVIPAPMGYIQLQSGDAISDYLPLLAALNTSVYALHEYVGILWYRIFYKM